MRPIKRQGGVTPSPFLMAASLHFPMSGRDRGGFAPLGPLARCANLLRKRSWAYIFTGGILSLTAGAGELDLKNMNNFSLRLLICAALGFFVLNSLAEKNTNSEKLTAIITEYTNS